MRVPGQPRSGGNALSRRLFSTRTLLASAALAAALAVAGCNTDGTSVYSSKADQPLSPAMLAAIDQKNMAKESPILLRLFKEEAEIEVWKQDRAGRYALLKTYPICRWSGQLGPKMKEGDRQAPEGFYSITPAQLNPNSQYYLSFNLGYPNAFDKALGRTGSYLMVHGDCSSRGCYAMTDEQIAEIFTLGRESFFGGQKAFQVQAYPFRMTPQNMAKHRNSPHYDFWKMLKRGSDHFETARIEPKIDVCEKRYVFNAEAPANASTPLHFDPKGKCPAFQVPQEILDAVNDKQRQDEIKTAELIARGTPTVPIRAYVDGGMNPVFLAVLEKNGLRDANGNLALLAPIKTDQGTIPTSVNLPREMPPQVMQPDPIVVANVPTPRAAPQSKIGAIVQEPSFADRLGSLFRPAQADNKSAGGKPDIRPLSATPVAAGAPAEHAKPAKSASLFNRAASAKDNPAARENANSSRHEGAPAKTSRMAARSPDKDDAAQPAAPAGAIAPRNAPQSGIDAEPNETPPSTTGSLIPGAQPIPATTSFENRWSAFR